MKRLPCWLALTLVVSAVLEPWDAVAQKERPPAIPEGFLLQPEFQTKKKTFAAGTAFLVKLEGQKRPVILTALHLIGPAGGYPEDVPAAKLSQVIDKVTVSDLFSGKNLLSISEGIITIPEAAPLGKASKAGDILALWGPEGNISKALPLAAKAPAKGELVWLAARVGGAPATQQLHRATVVGEQEGQLIYEYDNSKIELRATSGAPILNAAGEVVGINLGGGKQEGKVFGVANPVGVFRKHLLEGCQKYPPDKVKVGK